MRVLKWLLGVGLGLPLLAQANPEGDLLREILARTPGYTDSEALFFAVPIPVLKALEEERGIDRRNFPVEVVPMEWRARLIPGDDEAKVHLQMDFQVFKVDPKTPYSVFLFPANTVFERLALNNQPVDAHTVDNQMMLYLSSTGRHTVAGTLLIKPEEKDGHRLIRLSRDRFAVARLEVESDQGLDVKVEGMATRIQGEEGKGTHGQLALHAGTGVNRILWRPATPSVPRVGTPSVKPSMAWTVEPGRLAANGRLDVRFDGGPVEEMTLQIPVTADNVVVAGADVRDVRRLGGELKLFFQGALRGGTELRFSFDMPREIEHLVKLPTLSVSGGRMSEGGWYFISNDVGGELLEREVSGVAAVTALEVPDAYVGLFRLTPVLVYQIRNRSPQVVLDLVTTTPFRVVDTIADKVDAAMVVRPDGSEWTKIVFSMRNNRRQFMRLQLPEDSRIVSLKVEGKSKKPSRDGEVVLIPLVKSVQTLGGLISFPVELIYCRQGAPLEGHAERNIDLPELLEVPGAQVALTLYAPDRMKFGESQGTLAHVKSFTEADGHAFTYGYGHSAVPPDQSVDLDEMGLEWIVTDSVGNAAITNAVRFPIMPTVDAPVEIEGDILKDSGILNNPDLSSVLNALEDRPRPKPVIDRTLGANYWGEGYELYKRGDLKQAEEYLNKALIYNPKDSEAFRNAKNLLSNIPLAQGENEESGGVQDKAKASKIKKSLQQDVNTLEVRQSFLIEEGLEWLKQGKEIEASAFLNSAKRLGDEISAKGKTPEQIVIQNRFVKTLEELEGRKTRNRELKQELQSLKTQAQVIVLANDTNESEGQADLLFGKLAQAAASENVGEGEAQSLLFEGFTENSGAGPAQSVDEETLILSGEADVRSTRGRGHGVSLEAENQGIEKQVRVLRKTLAPEPVAPAKKPQAVVSDNSDGLTKGLRYFRLGSAGIERPPAAIKEEDQNREALRRIEKATAEALEWNRLLQSSGNQGPGTAANAPAVLDEKKAEQRLNELMLTCGAIDNSFSKKGKVLFQAIDSCRAAIVSGQQLVDESKKLRDQSEVVFLGNVESFAGDLNPVQQRQVQTFITANYDQALNSSGSGPAIQVVNGGIVADNTAGNADFLNDVFANWRANDGRVVKVAGQNLDASIMLESPALASLFTQRTKDGRRYGVLDEPLYQTLIQNGRLAPSSVLEGAESVGGRDVVVGSGNTIAGESVRLRQASRDSNGLLLDDTEITLPHNRYLCVDNGAFLTVLKAGKVRGWQDVEDGPVVLALPPPPELVFPAVGRAFRFEKTFLAAGESADVLLKYRYQN